jgi:hypothetical protein
LDAKYETVQKELKDWELRPVSNVPGLFLQKLPGNGKYKERLAAVVNPTSKKKGLIIATVDEAEQFAKVLKNPKTLQLVKDLDNGGSKSTNSIEI